ncbi:MAG: AsnC family transcriptional regulator, partial [Desulfosporosinus sp.]
MDSTDRALLNAIQNHFPIVVHPYQILGKAVGTTEEDAFRRIQRLRQEGIIRRLGGVFDSRRLGYYSTLCTAKVPENKIPGLARLLEGIPGVTHNYIRNHEYNVWFTLITRSQAVAASILQNIRDVVGVPEIYSLPAIRLFKINVNFDFDLLDKDTSQDEELDIVVDASLEDADLAGPKPEDSSPYELNNEDRALIRVLQGNLPDSITPYNVLAENLHWQVDDLIFIANRLLEEEVIRRFGAVLRHQKAGFVANVMGVWQVEPEQAAGVGKVMARFKEVSHCYQRPTLPDWPYSLFTMIHGRTAQDCENTMKRISLATGVKTYAMLLS